MKEILENIMLVGLGLAATTKRNMGVLVRRLVEEGRIAEPKANQFVEDTVDAIKKVKTSAQTKANELLKEAEKATRPPQVKKGPSKQTKKTKQKK